VQGKAQVEFSEIMEVKLERHVVKKHTSKLSSIDESQTKEEYVPVITFRMFNSFHRKVTGEIIEAKVNVMANVDAYQVDEETRKSAGNKVFPNLLSPLRSEISRRLNADATAKSWSPIAIFRRVFSPTVGREIEGPEDVGSKLRQEDSNPSTIFTKLAVSPDEHPFFRSDWPVSHILDESSPLLTNSCKQEGKDGKWPLNTQKRISYIENNIVFHEILITFSGLANASAESVFATKVYTFENLKFSQPTTPCSEYNGMDEQETD